MRIAIPITQVGLSPHGDQSVSKNTLVLHVQTASRLVGTKTKAVDRREESACLGTWYVCGVFPRVINLVCSAYCIARRIWTLEVAGVGFRRYDMRSERATAS